MKTVSISTLQHHFGRVLSWIQAGESVIIQRQKIPIAVLNPIQKPTQQQQQPSLEMPDFLGRAKKILGGRILPDSEPILDELREDRF